MSRSISFSSISFRGCVPPDSRCLPCSGVSRKTSVDSSRSGIKLVSDVKFPSLRHASRRTKFMCNASTSNYRRNSDYSRQKKHSYSNNRERHTAEKSLVFKILKNHKHTLRKMDPCLPHH